MITTSNNYHLLIDSFIFAQKNVFQVNSRPRRVQGAAPHRDAIEQRGFGAEPRAEREHSLRQVPGPDGDTAAVQA